MQIYLAKPGGQKEGPFSLEQINRDLAAKKYSGNDYWAWHEGLPSWMPLHSLPGVTGKASAVVGGAVAAKREPVASAPAPGMAASTAPKSMSSGLPFSDLDAVFILTSGEVRAVIDSQQVKHKLEDTVGEPLEKIRGKSPPNIIGHVEAGEEMMGDDSIPDKTWQTIAAVKPAVAEQGKAGAYNYCVRTLLSEQSDVITLLLFYRKQN
jgi:hypothetical protein